MIIGFTGTQQGMTRYQKEYLVEILKLKGCSELHHGDCIGADNQAATIALDNGVTQFVVHPPLHDYKRAYWMNEKKARMELFVGYHEISSNNSISVRVKWMEPYKYLERNKHIVESTALMIAAPKEHTHSLRSGTWATIRYAWKTKRDIIIIPPIERPDDDWYKISEEN